MTSLLNTAITLIAQYGIYVVGLIAIIFWIALPRDQKLWFVARFVIAGIIAIILTKVSAHFYFDTRPFVTQSKTPLIPHLPDNGFPSDHTTLTMLTALVVFTFSRKTGSLLVVCSLLIGITRVLALIHSPIDIAGSVAIAAIAVGLAGYIVTPYEASSLPD